MYHDFWWHLWNDPMRDNVWSLLLLVLIIGVTGILFWWEAGWNTRRQARRRERKHNGS